MSFTYIDGEYTVTSKPCPKKAAANHAAWEVWQEARMKAASNEDVTQWQRLNRATNALNAFHPTFNCEVM